MQEILIALVGALVGGIVGHWLSIGRDRRKEFNEHASTLYRDLEAQRLALLDEHYPGQVLATLDFYQIRRMLPHQKRLRLDVALRDYETAKDACGQYVDGEYVLQRPDWLIQKIEKLQGFLPHR